MKIFFCLSIAVALPLTQISGCTPIRKEIGPAIVQQSGNLPCFSIENTEKTRAGEANLKAIEVIGEQGSKIWFVELKKSSPFTPDQCIPYGQTTDVYTTKVPAEPLVPGQVYGVAIYAPMERYPYEVHGYTADFCLLKRPGQEILVHQVQFDPKTSRWLREVCKTDVPN
ncbi:hypothetical protein [Methylobacter sp. BBA5.1]|uniref:hypothetical protein n=1 Tax=Methylobacter sp. BBA5.1 TaxID=1495064 RepID=UPI000568C554|nr:hypothetical protein [Methylobacter sp. BBA5.1]